MVHWQDPEVIVYVFFIYEQIAVFLLGFYGTQFLWSTYIEWELITRKRAFRVVHIPWLLARYVMLSALLFFVITGRSRTRIACDVAYRTFASLGSGAAMLASLTLCSRPAAILWTLKQYIPVAILVLIGVGQAVIVVLQGILTVRAEWNMQSASCEVFSSDNHLLGGFYIYTFCFDVVILSMTLFAVHRVHMQHAYRARRWRFGDALCVQGIWYVAATCAVNVPVATLAFLNLNPGMNVLLSLPAVTISVIASSLTLFAFDDYNGKDANPRSGFGSGTGSRPSELVSAPLPGNLTTHISMDMGVLDSRVILDDDLVRLDDKDSAESETPSPSTVEHAESV
ncbi:uncharacterized protein TRAVEDRAFT_39151 [Trametes versicolor FP-101664 SS1]|uniref:uncharacterized protein n=1 Tax=Trametes versicolor (strain FP-101664) TaxID=717944 RepID=UPI0004623A5B|nr:uncharacterized protein TRAVEDRAFT_39151 [Trametes versicolor FP-101664 SS1]EIW56139.1 hypothetical protein TRAVEDRAFT_39151 [Trametes versicolor FP-101664 SS1]